MSKFAEKKALNKQLAEAKKKHGAKSQAAGRIQYKLNNLSADPKGNAVRTKSTTNKAGQTVKGSVIKTGNGGIVRTKPNPNATKGKRIISKGIARPLKTGGHPSAGRTVVPKKKVGNTVTTTGLNGKSKTVAAGSGKVIDIKSEGSIKTNTGKARNINGVGPNAAMNKRIKELERLIEKEKNSLR
tara:strand:+ start:43 stop:597 length:555 start_codon:yes stop_codon:yes gene_type:complete